ncbi:terpene synthase [Pseudomonas sp. ISL-88]|nr:terpene synthase [Pseudomonas sp. ISL-88]
MMISLNRALKLRDLEVFRVLKDGNILSYVIIEDTRKPFTEEDKKLEPLCYMDEEDINAILNVFKISIVNDEKLNEDDSISIRSYFSEFVNNTNLTNFIIKEYVQKDLYDYDDEDDIIFFNRILRSIGSDYVIKEFDDINWIYLSQD